MIYNQFLCGTMNYIPLYILLLTVTIVYSDESHLLIRKCCPETQQLDKTFETCVNYPGSSSIVNKERKSVSEVRSTEGLHFPWWMDSTALPLSPDTGNRVQYFLGEENESKYIEFGVRPNCIFTDNAILGSKSPNVDLLSNGSLLYHAADQKPPDNITFAPTSYCVDHTEDGIHIYMLCSCLETMCIKKCCSLSKMRNVSETQKGVITGCRTKSNEMKKYSSRPIFYSNRTSTTDAPRYVLFNNVLKCDDNSSRVFVSPSVSKFWMYANGSVLVDKYGHGIPYSRDQYCWDMTYNESEDTVQEVLTICAKLETAANVSLKGWFYVFITVIGSIFLFLTLIVLAISPVARKKNTRIVMCQTVSLLVAYVTYVAVQLLLVLSPAACRYIPLVIQFFFLAAFFWMNVMCIDIFWTFSKPLQSYTRGASRTFLYYSLYAWGSPAIICIVTAVMDFDENIPDDYIKPALGVFSCWFQESAVFAYFYGPIAVLQLINILLFVYTAVALLYMTARFKKGSESRRHVNKIEKKRLVLYVNLFIVMGLTWITEVISWAVESGGYFWYITDAVNALRGLFIFIILCCKRPVIADVKNRLHSWGVLPKCLVHEGTDYTTSSTNTQCGSADSMPMSERESKATAVNKVQGNKISE